MVIRLLTRPPAAVCRRRVGLLIQSVSAVTFINSLHLDDAGQGAIAGGRDAQACSLSEAQLTAMNTCNVSEAIMAAIAYDKTMGG